LNNVEELESTKMLSFVTISTVEENVLILVNAAMAIGVEELYCMCNS